jgi:hypothetical protein
VEHDPNTFDAHYLRMRIPDELIVATDRLIELGIEPGMAAGLTGERISMCLLGHYSRCPDSITEEFAAVCAEHGPPAKVIPFPGAEQPPPTPALPMPWEEDPDAPIVGMTNALGLIGWLAVVVAIVALVLA